MKQRTHTLGTAGFSLTETMVALLLTAVLTTTAYQFFVGAHQQTISQLQVSDMQQTTRVTLDEIARSLKTAGFKLPTGTPSYVIKGESLFVFSSQTQPIDSTVYYLTCYTSSELANLNSFPAGLTPKKLMRRTNHGTATAFADYVTKLSYQVLDSIDLKIAMTVVAPLSDQTFKSNSGFRTASDTTQVRVRNYKS